MDNESYIMLNVIAGTLILVLFIFMIIIFVVTYNNKMQKRINEHSIQLKNKELELLKSIIETQESEREKIASNLHDEVGPLLSTLKLNFTRFKRALNKNELTGEQLDQEKKFIDEIIDNVRTVSHDLTPHFLLKFGLSSALENFYAKTDYPKININSQLSKNKTFTRTVTLNAYRIVLELINNIIKHDPSDIVTVDIKKDRYDLTIIIEHNGSGITNEEFEILANESKGLGLNSIQSRVVILNAKLDFEKSENQARINLKIPLI